MFHLKNKFIQCNVYDAYNAVLTSITMISCPALNQFKNDSIQWATWFQSRFKLLFSLIYYRNHFECDIVITKLINK